MRTVYFGNELYHHGIKGQRWGVRNYQEEDGSLTAKGEKHYGIGDGKPGKQTETNSLKSSGKSSSTSSSKGRRVELKDIEKQPEIKGHRNKLIEKYKKQGMSQKEAEAAAEKRIQTEKKVAIGVGAAAAVAIAAGAFYMHNKNSYTNAMTDILGDKAKDVLNSPEAKAADIKLKHFTELGLNSVEAKNLSKNGKQYLEDSKINFKDMPLHRVVNQGETIDGKHAAYISFGDDSKKYRALYGGVQMARLGRKPVELTVNTVGNVHLAGRGTAEKAFKDLLNDSSFRQNVRDTNKGLANNEFIKMMNPERAAVHSAAEKSLQSLSSGGSISDKEYANLYKAFNINLYNHSSSGNAASETFYNKLKDLGYHAIEDVNDKEFSGYNSKNPLIVFDWKAFDLNNITSETLNVEQEARNAQEILTKMRSGFD